ncbi:hypothetical protein QJQ45_027280, partial [Haematococcus lacustris]
LAASDRRDRPCTKTPEYSQGHFFGLQKSTKYRARTRSPQRKPTTPLAPAREMEQNETSSAETAGNIGLLQHAASYLPSGLATVRVRLGTREYLRGTFAGRRLPTTLYRGQTSGAPDSAKRRLDASLAHDGALMSITGLFPGQTHVAFTATGSISAAEPTRRNMPLPTLHILSDLRATEQDMLMWMARKGIEPVTQPHQAKAVHGRPLKDLYYNDVRYKMASYEFSTTVQQAPRLQAAHELDPYLTNISHSREWQVETGRMLMIFKPAPPPHNTQHQTAVRAVITVDASEAGAALDMPATLLLKDFTVARTLQLAVCSMALATAGAPPRAGTPGTAAMYAQTIRQSQPFPVMSALDTAMVEQQEGSPYMVTTFNDRLGHILRTYGILKVEIPGMFTLKLVTAEYTAQIPRYCLAITVPQADIAEAALGQILELLSGAHARSTAATVLVAKYPGPGTWEQRLSGPVRPLTYSNNLGDIMTAGTNPGTFNITSKQPLGERISTNTHAADSMEAAYLPFFTLEGYPLFLRKATGAILVSFASNQDLANAVAAAAVDMGGILQLGEEQLQVALPEGLTGCKPPRSVEYPGYTTFAIIQEGSEQDNYINTGLYNIPDRNMLILRAIIAASSNTTLIAVPDANKTQSVLVNATHALVRARTATTAECTFQPAVELAGTQRGPTRDQPRANPAPLTGWGSSIALAGQIQAHQRRVQWQEDIPPAAPAAMPQGGLAAAFGQGLHMDDNNAVSATGSTQHLYLGQDTTHDHDNACATTNRDNACATNNRHIHTTSNDPMETCLAPCRLSARTTPPLAQVWPKPHHNSTYTHISPTQLNQGQPQGQIHTLMSRTNTPTVRLLPGGTGAGIATMATAGLSTAGNPFPMVRNTYRSITRPHQTQHTSHTPLAPPSAAAQMHTNYCQHPLPHRSTPEAARLHSPLAQEWGRRDTHPCPGKAKRHQVRSCAHDAIHTYAPHHLYPNVTPTHTPPMPCHAGHGTGTSLVWGHSRALRMAAGNPDPPVGNTQACNMSLAPRPMPRTSTQSTLSTYNMQLNCHGQRRWHRTARRGLPSALAEAWRSLPETIPSLQEIHQVISHIAPTSSSQNTQYNLLTSHHILLAIAEMLIDNNGTLTSNAFGEDQQVSQQAPHTQTRSHPTPPSWPPTAPHVASPAQGAQPQPCPWLTTTHTFTPDHPPSLPRRPTPGQNSQAGLTGRALDGALATADYPGHLGGRNGWKQLIAQAGFEPNAIVPDSTLAIGREHSRRRTIVSLANMLTTVAICAQMLTTICLNMAHTTRPTKKDSDRRPGHSMAMKCIDGAWNLLDSMQASPTPLLNIPAATKRTVHQLFIITPNTRTRDQMRRCEEKGIHHIISHAEQTSNRDCHTVTDDLTHPTTQACNHDYMERQYEECCLVHAFNMAMGKKCIDYHEVINHCKQLAEHLQHLAQEAREAGYAIRGLKTDHIYHEKGKFSSDTLNHYLYRKHHEMRTYLHPASTFLPTQSITPEVITAVIASSGATHKDAVILLSYQHATAIKHTEQGWHQLDSFNRVPKPLSTPEEWGSLQGNILTICTGDVRHTRFVRREIWIADPLEATNPSALAAHFQDHLEPIDLTKDNTEARETTATLHATTINAETSYTADSKRRATAEGIPQQDEPTRLLRQRRDTPTVTLRPQTMPRTHRPTTPLGNAADAAKKRVRTTKGHCNDTHTQTLMFKYLCKPNAKAHNTKPVSTIDDTPESMTDNDLGTNQHHSPPPPPTLNRQHITLTTFNVRGLHRSRNEVLNLVHSQSPDILILTETMTQPRSNNPSSGWLKRVMPNYTVHRHQGHSEVLIGIRHDLAIQMQATMMQPCTDADVNTRCVILSLRQRQSEELTLVATYWPSGNNDDALPLRKKMQEHIRTTTGHLPGSLILAGDINATMKTEDRSEHTEYTQDKMMREFAAEMRLSEADSGERAWTYQQPHCNSRIDAILTRDARHGPEHRTHVDTHAYLSDHRPLTATLSTARLGIDLAAPQKPQKHSHTILTTPITNEDREAYRLAVQQPSSGAPQLHAHLTAYLAPMYTDAIHFLTNIDKANPQQPQRLTLVAGLPAREAVDTAATMLTSLLQTCRTTAIKTCNTKTLTRGGQHYQRRTMCRIREALGKKLKSTRELSRKAIVFFKQNNVHPTIDELIPETDTTNAETREAVQARQGDDTTENHVQAALARLTNSYRDQIHKLDDDDSALAIAQARVRMQQLISTQPKKANKYILRPSRTDHKGLQALADPITNKICTAPADLNRIITEAYGTKLAPPTPKTGNYTNTQTRNYPWARAKADDPFTMHTCQNVHWLHTAIMDKASFQECLSRLSGGKAPGPDGIENEIIKMLPWEMRDTIHQLFIIMWATGCTPTTWKTSDTCLLYKDKGQETDLNSYRPVGLANTVYKLWTSLITKTLSEYAEANGMLSKNQAGFRSHRDTTQQLQMLVMALEDAKLAKADIYALLVDFTSAFNTTCQDKLLWIMHDLGFPTDATDAVKDLYTGATTRFKTPYGHTDPVPVNRGTIQGDSLSPFLFLIYIEPLLRWLQVGARGYKFKSATADSGERATVSSIDYADDIALLCNTLRNLRCQADKLSAFSDWGHLIISHSKTLATAALHHSVETGMCSNAAEADKRARQQLQTVSLQGKPVTYHRPTSPFTYLGVLITMTLDWKPQHTAMITQLRHKLERLRRSFASARQAIHIIRTAIIPSLAYSFCAVPCTPGDLELYDRSINQCVKLKLRLPLGTPNAIVREDAGKLGMGISSTAQEYHARNTTALTHSLQSTDVTHAHISRSMLHKQITWLNTQANTQGHRMLTLFHHTLRARQLVYTSLAGLSATEGGLPLYPKECQTLGRLITQASSSNAHDVVSASITCLKSLGITHASELSCEGNTHIITGSMLTSKYGKKVKQKHIIALNKLAAMATQPSCPDATATRTIRDSRNTSLTLPPDQRKITPWAAGLTGLAPTPAVPDTRTRYMDMKAYAATHATQPDTTERAAAAAAPDAIRARSRLLQREQRATSSHPTEPTRPKAGAKRHKDGRHVHTIPADIVRIPGLDLPGLSSWKVDKACRCKLTDLGHILGAMYDHQEVITNIDGWQWDGINKESYYKVHWKPTVIERWALHLCAKEGYTPTHIETISREEAKDVCTCELCWLPRGDCPTCHNCKRAYHPACLEQTLLSGHKEPGYWLCPICKFGSKNFKTTMRQSAHSDLIRVHWRPTLEPAPLITAHLDYTAQRNIYDEENRTIQEARHARPDANLPDHTRQGLPDPHTWLPRCTNLHSKATFHTYPINPQTDIVGTGKCETFLQLHPHLTTPAMSLRTGEPIMPKHDLVQHVTVHDETGRTAGLLTKQQHQHLHAWLQHTPHARNLATELVALLRRHGTQSSHHPMRAAQDKALATLHTTLSFPSTVQRWADPLTVRPETATYWSPDINDTAFGAHHNCLLVRHTGLSTWNVPADDAVALKCVNHAIHSATQEEAMATIMLIPGKKGISYPKHIDTLRRYPEYCQHLASIPPTKTTCSKPGKHAKLHIYTHTQSTRDQRIKASRPHPPAATNQHMRLPLHRDLPTAGHQRSHQQLTQHSTTQPRMAVTEWATLAYTDGSCIKTSGAAPASVGAGVYIPETNVLITVTLDDPESNTINKAELTAIHAALTAGAKRIATDSLCSIYQIRRALATPMSLITHRHNDILTAIATLIIDSPVTIHFYKVRAHSGIIGNEGADALAKHAALHPELANTPAYRPTTRKETNTWLSNEADGESPAPLPDCRQSVRAHMHRKHSLGLANQDSIYYQMSQEITKAAAKGAGARVMTDTNISIPAQRTALLYRTGGLYNQKLAMRWKRATDDRCPLCGEADSATHLLSGCSETLPMVQERHNGAGRLIAKAISKGTLGGSISFADTGSWEKGAKDRP